ncbi:hypothetical protein MBANPS3_006166 [Mucor bainieri]
MDTTSSSSLLRFYRLYIVPHLSKRNKVIGISAAITVSLCYLIRERVFKPPKNLHHIPYHTYFDVLQSILTGESYWDRSYRLAIPQIDAKGNNGIYVRPGRTGFEVRVANAHDAKYVLAKTDLFPKVNVGSGTQNSLNTRFIGGPNILVLNGQHWKDQRKVMNPSFHRSMPVKVFGALVVDLFKAMEDVMDVSNNVIEVTDLMTRWTLDAIGKAGFDFDFKAVKEKNNAWVTIYNKINEGMQNALFFIFPILDEKFQWLSPKRQQVHRDLTQFIGMIDEVIQTRRDEIGRGDWKNNHLEENEKDILSLMIESENRGEGIMSNEELKSNILLFFFAGHETTSNALSFAIYYLAKHQDIQDKARAESISILGTESTDILPSLEQTKQMTYINQIIKETLRINGPVIGIVPRAVTEDTVLSGTFIPKGSTITVDIFNVLHSEKVFKNSKTFDPDRFAKRGNRRETADDEEDDDITGWIPFGSGARNCRFPIWHTLYGTVNALA